MKRRKWRKSKRRSRDHCFSGHDICFLGLHVRNAKVLRIIKIDMHSNLDIQVNSQSMVLPNGFSLNITEENPIFHDVEMHSDPVQVPIEGNRHVFKNVDNPQSDLRPIDFERQKARIIASGIPFRNGTISIQNDDELDGNFSFNIDEASQSFNDLIGDLKCQDVPLFQNENIPIGEKIVDVNVNINYDESYKITGSSDLKITGTNKNITANASFDPQALGFSCPGVVSGNGTPKEYPDGITVKVPHFSESYINVTEPYQSENGKPVSGSWRYCNARVCYAHHGLDKEKAVPDVKDKNGKIKVIGTIGETTDNITSVNDQYAVNEDYGPYWVLDANRQQSGICFYVLYFLDCLFSHLGVQFDNSALTAIEDFRRLCFFTTKCKYTTESSQSSLILPDIDSINSWLDTRGCGGNIEVADTPETNIEEMTVSIGGKSYYFKVGSVTTIDGVLGPVDYTINSIKCKGVINNFTANAKVSTMYATSENFPDESVSTIISSLEASFGVRFRYDYQAKKVTAYLMRDIFRQNDSLGNKIAPVILSCNVLKVNKLADKITGVRMKYSAESDPQEQQQNIRTGKRDYGTDFDYADYRQDRTIVDNNGYIHIATDLKVENVTCYVDRTTANAYRFKISKEIADETVNIAYHRLFEVGQFHGIEVGDCSKKNEDFIKEFISDFQPMSFNDVNAYAELRLGSTQPILAAFVDEDMEHEFVTHKINHPISSLNVDMYATEVLRLIESYDTTSTDDGNSPLQSIDWGLAIAVMRGGGADASIENYAPDYDGFGNSKWKTIAGQYSMSSDTMDQFGNQYDYNGTSEGIGDGERFSLKIRSWKPFLYYIDVNGKTIVTSDLSLEGEPVAGVSGKTWLIPSDSDSAISSRGLADVFMSENIYFLLNNRKLRIHCLMELSVLVDIPNHWDHLVKIGEFIGYIDKLNYDISCDKGVGEVIIDFYSI